ncbi:protein-methionine-sulfoxide reductase catalytic subunit MsrP [Pleionea sp. CnH1-48]|uniref:protein-methionine-sulfoxide reductase catalytic subunit MsrP n=1 Tax=Pleionea sp. CnH1-48 TaxID=2954494 RepID=UPI002097097D|nr:protein-methionine-sulfoxide reductase catalytic subunit MsrP [Pleionea sp. CnH1-48]MCO7223655.1 protein-methionine-sulfoxide reductase catalytic subunit MsrP [Pleionea sp. CnH1-48]
MKSQPITPEHMINTRREFIRKAVQAGLLSCLPLASVSAASKLKITDEAKATRYNNYYEFSTNKKFVHIIAKDFKPEPWTLSIEGLVDNPLSISLASLPQAATHILRFRCIEGWSMIVPWQGFELAKLLELAKPTSAAKYVRFESIKRPSEMIGQRRNTLPWPYSEGLRLDEAMHPLTLIANGMYGKPLPNQNGAPLRLIVPWKYGFKSIKAIAKIELVAEQPQTTWNSVAPAEYGFYANVNPEVPHPRWSQRREVPLGELKKVRTLPFNGYEDQVAHLYKGMDLSKHF